MSNIIDLSSFQKASLSLGVALDEYLKTKNVFVRDACIQRFEYCYELSHKTLKRHLEKTSANPDEVDSMSFQELIRSGSERGLLLSGWSEWRRYRALRAATSHTYDEDKALEVLEKIPEFYDEAQYLLKQLTDHNEQDG